MSDLTNDIPLDFKTERARREFALAPQRLRDIAFAFAVKSNLFGIRPTITRVREDAPNQATLVHASGRAVDFRDAFASANGVKRIYSDDQVASLIAEINLAYPRSDGKTRILHHSVADSTPHFHIQIAYAELTRDERERFQ